jgi:predicted nucleotidyltransferase
MSERSVRYSKETRERAKGLSASMITNEVDSHYAKKGRITLQVILDEKHTEQVRKYIYDLMKSTAKTKESK